MIFKTLWNANLWTIYPPSDMLKLCFVETLLFISNYVTELTLIKLQIYLYTFSLGLTNINENINHLKQIWWFICWPFSLPEILIESFFYDYSKETNINRPYQIFYPWWNLLKSKGWKQINFVVLCETPPTYM